MQIFRIIFLLILLELATAKRSRSQWKKTLTPCHEMASACDVSCYSTYPSPLPCHIDSGYCICSKQVKPPKNCRKTKGIAEQKACNAATCKEIKADEKEEASDKIEQILIARGLLKWKSIARICTNEQDAAFHCACFSQKLKETKVKVVHLGEKGHDDKLAYKFK